MSKSDLPANKYRKIAVFVEDPNPSAPSPGASAQIANGQLTLFIPTPSGSSSAAEIEHKVLAALGSAGIVVNSPSSLFKGQKLNDQAKAQIIQKEFDAVLYLTILANGMKEQLVEGAWHNGQVISVNGETKEIDIYDQNTYELKPDGTVYRSVPTLQTKTDLQDTKTNKLVWSSETIATGGTLVLASRVSEQIVEKMRADGAI